MLKIKIILSNICYTSFLILTFCGFGFAQNANTENDCAISIENITPSSAIENFGIINNNDILAIYNNLQKICKGNQNQDGYNETSYMIQMYKSIIKDKFLLANIDYSITENSNIISDPIAKKRYDKKIEYYKNNEGLNPEQIKGDFDDLRKYGIYTNAVNPDTCIYKPDKTKGLYDKLYNTCDMAYCMRTKIITNNMDSNIINAEYESCKLYIDNIVYDQLFGMNHIIIEYSAKMTNNNFDTYINKYIGFRMANMQILQDKVDSLMNFLLKKITSFTKNCMS